jgi:hypothetical protein
MELSLQPEEVTLLRQVLANYLADLRMEIGKTEQYDFRQALKRNEALLKGLLARLESPAAGTPEPGAISAAGRPQ